jgi:hypothetical protein
VLGHMYRVVTTAPKVEQDIRGVEPVSIVSCSYKFVQCETKRSVVRPTGVLHWQDSYLTGNRITVGKDFWRKIAIPLTAWIVAVIVTRTACQATGDTLSP